MSITRDDIDRAAQRVAGHVRHTPVLDLAPGTFGLPARIILKLESLQHAGSFKARGAFNALITASESTGVPAAGVIAASGGNHGAAVAYAARSLGHRAEIFVPKVASPAKLQRLRDFGAEVQVVGAVYAEALAACQARQQQTGALSVHAYDEPAVLAGQGTLGRELQQQVPDLDAVLIAVGGGGLIGGIAAWYHDGPGEKRTKVIGVEPSGCPTLHAALAAGRPVDVDVSGVAADSLGARRIGALTFANRQAIDGALLVEDEAIRETRRLLWRELRLAVEPGGATALAALISGRYPCGAGDKIGVVICGGNTDPGDLA
ncbi:MAG TPA: threonine/serine dehydratase [Terriglobales bacterium]|nr:threonine/serine dehydratase [Terriglobales bacterium]